MSKKILMVNPDKCVEVHFDQQMTIGRDVYNSLCLKDPELSRSHAIIFEQDGETVIKDLRSRNGVFVRGEKASEAVLQPGDEIIVGSTVMLFEPADDVDLEQALTKRGRFLIERQSGKLPSAQAEPDNIFSTQEMDHAIEALFGKPDGSTYFTTYNAIALLQAVKDMDATEDSAELFDVALRRAMAALGGHRGVIMECGEDKERLKVRSLVSEEKTDTILIGQPVLKTVLSAEKCLFCADLKKQARYEGMAAKCRRPIHSFVAAPIKNGSELFGFIYLDSEDPTVSYDFAALRSLYFITFHVGALLRARPRYQKKVGLGLASH